VGEIERTMTIRELSEWQRYCFHHPLPAEVADIHGAMHTALLANIHRARDAPMVDAVDFMVLRTKPEPDPAKPALTIAQQMKRVANG
jgi:hypothetical protein